MGARALLLQAPSPFHARTWLRAAMEEKPLPERTTLAPPPRLGDVAPETPETTRGTVKVALPHAA